MVSTCSERVLSTVSSFPARWIFRAQGLRCVYEEGSKSVWLGAAHCEHVLSAGKRAPNRSCRICSGRPEDGIGTWSEHSVANPFLRNLSNGLPLNTWRDSSACASGSRGQRFIRQSGCCIVDPALVWAELSLKELTPVHSVGDSVMHQNSIAFNSIPRKGKGRKTSATFHWATFHRIECIPRTLSGWRSFRNIFEGMPRRGIVFMNFGLWYNVPRSVNNLNGSYDSALNATYSRSEMVRDAQAETAYCHAHGIVDGGGRQVCDWRRKTGRDTPAHYRYDMQMLVAFMHKERASFPRYVFWIDPTPQHYEHCTFTSTKSKQCYPSTDRNICKWRSRISIQAWSIHPDIGTYLHVSEPLLKSPFSHWNHPLTGTADCTHWCMASTAFNEHIAWILTAALSRIQGMSF